MFTKMQGSNIKNIFPTINDGTTIKNFDFNFCDLIKQPTASNISDINRSVTKKNTAYLKQKNNVFFINTLKPFIQLSIINPPKNNYL